LGRSAREKKKFTSERLKCQFLIRNLYTSLFSLRFYALSDYDFIKKPKHVAGFE